MRVTLGVGVVLGLLAACSPSAPNDQDLYYENIKPDPVTEAPEPYVNDVPTPSVVDTVVAQELPAPRQELAVEPELVVENTIPTPIPTPTPTSTVPVAQGGADISNTQDFEAVQQKETIASDAEKLAVLKAQYQVVEPEALPERSSDVNLAAYALEQKQAVGSKTYRRTGGRNSSGCGRYRKDPDEAQRVFLRAGGPAKDRKNLDTDGDGFACNWNPDTYRRLVNN